MTTLTRNRLRDALSIELEIPKQQAYQIIESTFNEMIENLATDGELKLSAFGSFLVRSKKNRIGRNPRTGVEVTITSRRIVSFRASSHLKRKISHIANEN